MSDELAKQMLEHGITNPWDLSEYDQWVNDAIRVDVIFKNEDEAKVDRIISAIRERI